MVFILALVSVITNHLLRTHDADLQKNKIFAVLYALELVF